MKIKAFVTKSLLISLAFMFVPTPAYSAQKITPGSACKVNKQSVTYLKKTFTCVKSGKKLFWNKGVLVASQTTESTSKSPAVAPMTYTSPKQPSSSIELCKTKEVSQFRNVYENALATGFPSSKLKFATKSGTVKWALIPIDFSDFPGEKNFKARVEDQMKLLTDWYETVSEGKFKIEWVVADKWVTLPGVTSDYVIPLSANLNNAANGPKLFKAAMNAADPVFNFTNIETVNFILPSGQSFIGEGSQGFPWDQAVKEYISNEGPISSYSIPGKFFDQSGRQYWSYWAHEFGHAMGIPHVGSSHVASEFMGLDLMGNQDGYARELTGWLRFVTGWLDEKKVYCQELSKLDSSEFVLVPLSGKEDGIKMIIIPVSETESLVIESRRETKFSCAMPTNKNGVLAYLYDAKLGHNDNFLIPLTPSGRSPERSDVCQTNMFPDPLLYKGQKIDAEGVTIEVLDSRNFDRIRISKAS
jgi:M6 family metalloprotease-like protein